MDLNSVISVGAYQLLAVLLVLVAIAFLVGWVLGQRGERRVWVETARMGAYLVCDDKAYSVTRLDVDVDQGFDIPWPWPTSSPMEKHRITHRVAP